MENDRRTFLRVLSATVLALPLVSVGAAFAETKDLNAEVRPSKPKPEHRPPTEPSAPVTVGLSPIGPSVLPIGANIRFRVTTNHSGYGHLYVTNASGNVVMLVENLPLKANRSVDLPRGGVVLRAAPPVGDNNVLFLATRDRFDGFAGGESSAVPTDLQVTGDGFLASLKSRLADIPRDRWGFTDVTIRVTE